MNIALDSSMTDLAFTDSTIADTTFNKIVGLPFKDKKYWWRMRARNAGGWGSYSALQNFSTTAVTERSTQPLTFGLGQNFPNPFNPSTTIRYALPKAGLVTLRIFDLLGNEVELLVNAKQPAGEYRIEWHPRNLPSGVYLYRLQTRDFLAVKKLVLLR